MRAPLLVIAHEATRTGSPRVLLELLRVAVPRLDVPVAVRLLASGPLAAELSAIATASDDGARPAAVFANGALAAHELERWGADMPTAIYVHEEGEALAALDDAAVRALRMATTVLCVSDRSARSLLGLGVAADRMSVVPPVVVGGPPLAPADRDTIRAHFGVPAGGRLVVGCGEAGWRKGADLFVQVIRAMAATDPNLRAGWIGRRGRWFGRILDHDTASSGLADRLRWVGEIESPAPVLAAADLLVMTSREDPQPLVPLEAALAGTPTVGFAVGGLLDYAEDGLARVARYPDVIELAGAAGAVLADPDAGVALVDAGRRRVERRQSLDVVGPRFVDELVRLVALADTGARR